MMVKNIIIYFNIVFNKRKILSLNIKKRKRVKMFFGKKEKDKAELEAKDKEIQRLERELQEAERRVEELEKKSNSKERSADYE